MREVHPEDGVAWLQECEVDRHVGACSRVWLDVCVFGAKDLLCTVTGDVFDDIHPFAPAVVAVAWVAFGVLVCQRASLRFTNSTRDNIFAGNQLEFVCLPGILAADCCKHIRVSFREVGFKRRQRMASFRHASRTNNYQRFYRGRLLTAGHKGEQSMTESANPLFNQQQC